MTVKQLPHPDVLRKFLRYEEETGKLFWRNKFNNREAFTCTNTEGYKCGRFLGERYKAHRVAWAIFYGRDPGIKFIDHVNGDRSDNRIQNLREATAAENCRNTKPKLNATSKFKGVCWSESAKKWRARITSNGKMKHLGYFDCESDAAEVYQTAAKADHKDFIHKDVMLK